jgi:hypothetical protein
MFSGMSFEEMIAGLAWLITLQTGWSVEWDSSPANHDSAE